MSSGITHFAVFIEIWQCFLQNQFLVYIKNLKLYSLEPSVLIGENCYKWFNVASYLEYSPILIHCPLANYLPSDFVSVMADSSVDTPLLSAPEDVLFPESNKWD